MKPKTNTQKAELIENCIEIGANLEKITRKQLTQDIGWITDGMIDLKISLIINHHTAWFICDNNTEMTISSDLIKSKINNFQTYDGVYIDLNNLITEAYN